MTMNPDNPPSAMAPLPRRGWQRVWQGRGVLAWALLPLAGLHGLLLGLRRRGYALGWLRSHKLPVPVVVVGNVVVGGAGKTPTVIALLAHLHAHGWTPGVISRGHGRRTHGVLEVLPDTPTHDSGDEPALIRQRSGVPVFVARERVEAGRALLAAHPAVDLLVCDDGLQHWALERDVAIAVFDERGTGNGWLLPAGLLREPWPSRRGPDHVGAARGPDLVLHQRAERPGARPAAGPSAPCGPPLPMPPGLPCFCATRRLADSATNAAGARADLRTGFGQGVTAVAGIAQPTVFFQQLRQRGLSLSQCIALPDHAPVSDYAALIPPAPGALLCTEKDAVKLFALARAEGAADRVWAVPLELTLEPAFLQALDERLAQR